MGALIKTVSLREVVIPTSLLGLGAARAGACGGTPDAATGLGRSIAAAPWRLVMGPQHPLSCS